MRSRLTEEVAGRGRRPARPGGAARLGCAATWLAVSTLPCHRRVVLNDPSLRIAQWLMLFGAVVWAFMLATGVMGVADFAGHELFSLLAFVVLRRLQRGQRAEH